MSTVGLISIGVLILAVGIGVGFLLGHTLRQRELTRAADVRDELNQYRRDVSDHFDQTAVHFQSIGKQYRDLYEHMAIGAGALCDATVPGRELPFSPGAVLPPIIEPEEAAADTAADVRPATDIPAQVDDDAENRPGEEVDVATDDVHEGIRADTDDTVEAGDSAAQPEIAADGESASESVESESIDDKRIYH